MKFKKKPTLNGKIKHSYKSQKVALYCKYDWLMSIQQKSTECLLQLEV